MYDCPGQILALAFSSGKRTQNVFCWCLFALKRCSNGLLRSGGGQVVVVSNMNPFRSKPFFAQNSFSLKTPERRLELVPFRSESDWCRVARWPNGLIRTLPLSRSLSLCRSRSLALSFSLSLSLSRSLSLSLSRYLPRYLLLGLSLSLSVSLRCRW